MHRRTAIVGVGSLLLAGCLSGDDPSSSTTDEPSPTAEPTPTATPEPKQPETDFGFNYDGESNVTIVHLGGDTINDEATSKLLVRVNDERVSVVRDDTDMDYWLADNSALGENETRAYSYPLSIGNSVTVSAESGDTVEVVWVGSNGTESVLASYDVVETTTTTEA